MKDYKHVGEQPIDNESLFELIGQLTAAGISCAVLIWFSSMVAEFIR